MFTGSCLCGGIAFEVAGPLAPIQICHCSQCRKAQGSAFAANIPVESSAFRLVHGAGLLTAYESSSGKRRLFCGRCGSPVYSCRDDKPGVLRLRAGLLEGPITARPTFHAWTASAADWWPITDELPRHAGSVPPASTAPR